MPGLHDAAYGAELKPEKNRLEVAIAATGPLYLPVILANEAGYFSKRGVTVNLTTLSATASAQALLSGQVDIYQGGTATIHANVAGSDLIYVAASVDRSTLVLFGQKGITSFDQLRGKSVATTSVGAFGEIAIRKTARERGMRFPVPPGRQILAGNVTLSTVERQTKGLLDNCLKGAKI